MYTHLNNFNKSHKAFSERTRAVLWTKPHLAKKMLETHLNQETVAASRPFNFIDQSVEFIDEQINLKNKSVVDFGCGPGLYTSRFAQLGANVTGIDFSGNSLEYATQYAYKEGLKIEYLQKDYLQYKEVNKYDFATLIYCDYCAIGPESRRKLLSVIYNSLKEDGYFLLDVHTINMFETLKESNNYVACENGGFYSEAPYFLFTKDVLYKEDYIGLTHYMIVEENETWEIYNWLQYFTLESLKKELLLSGFEVTGVFDDVTGAAYTGKAYDMAVICKKI